MDQFFVFQYTLHSVLTKCKYLFGASDKRSDFQTVLSFGLELKFNRSNKTNLKQLVCFHEHKRTHIPLCSPDSSPFSPHQLNNSHNYKVALPGQREAAADVGNLRVRLTRGSADILWTLLNASLQKKSLNCL